MPNPQKKANTNRILELDALRGIAALAIVLFHFTMDKPEAQYGFKFGVTGVDLFFIISGFVILLTIENTKTWRDFIINRASRLYPTYWACVTITTALFIFISGPWPGIMPQYLANLTMFQSFLSQKDIDGPYWTMLVEMLFYIYMVLFLIFKQNRRIELVSMCVTGLVFGYAVYCYFTPPDSLFYLLTYHLVLINHFPLFCAGIVFYKMMFDKLTFWRYGFLAVCFICQLLLFKNGGRSHFYLSALQNGGIVLFYFALFYCFIKGYLKFLITPVTLFLGNISFSLYLIHQALGVSTIAFLSGYVPKLAAYGITLILVIVIAYAINRFVEVPGMLYIRRKYRSAHLNVPANTSLN